MAVRELVSFYVAMEEFYMEQNVGKAIEIREHSPDSLTTSMVDDAFFILQKARRPPLSAHMLVFPAQRRAPNQRKNVLSRPCQRFGFLLGLSYKAGALRHTGDSHDICCSP